MLKRDLQQCNLSTKWILILAMLLLANNSFSTIKYVMYGGSGNKSGDSWANASDLLRQTIENASTGDEVWVAGGDNTGDGVVNYNDHFRMDYKMVINKNIKIYGGFPRPNVVAGVSNPQMKDRNMVKYASIFDGTIMFAAPVKSLFEQTVVLTDALFDGFYVVNATDEKGAGIRMKDGLTISNCVFVNNKATSATEGGGAIYMEGGTLVNCIITNNECTNLGAGIYAKGNSKIINCTVVNNKTNGAGGRAICIDGILPSVNNTIFWNNIGVATSNDAAYVNGASVAQIKHCSYNLLPGSSADNTLISSANTGIDAPYFVSPNAWQGIHTDTFWGQSVPATGTMGNVQVFTFANLGDWYLQDARSVMFDKGDQTLIPAFLKTDIENNPRVRNKFVDIGCYELQPINVLGWTLSNPKTYNGNNYGSVTSKGSITPAIADVGVDSVMVRYDNKNVGSGKTVTLSFILNGSESAKFFAEDTVTTGDIIPLPITVTADSVISSTTSIESFSKIYGDADPTFTYRVSPTMPSADTFTGALSRSSIASQNIGTYNITQGTFSAGSNYTMTFIPTTFKIEKKSIEATAGAVTKIYDGSTNASLPTLSFALDQLLAGDVGNVTAAATAATYNDKNIGTNKTVSVTGITISGTASANYKISSSATNNSSSITKRPIDANIYVEVDTTSKIYDGTTTVTRQPALTVKGLFGTDIITASYDASTTASFNNKNVGTSKTVTVSNISFGGADVNNYTLATSSSNTNSEIKVRPLKSTTFIEVGSTSKVFDGTTTVTSLPTLTPTGLIGTDVVTASYGTLTTALFDTKNVGSGNKIITISNILLGGADIINYTISSTATNNTSSITPLPITITPDSMVTSTDSNESFSKCYGQADPIFTYRNTPTLMSGDSFSGALDRLGNTDQTVGSYDITLGNLTAGINYTLSLTASPVTFNILQKAVSVSNIKINDRPFIAGDVSATVNYWGDVIGGEFGDILKIDSLIVTNAYYATDALGGNKQVFFTPSNLTLQGDKKSNYKLIQPIVKGNVGVASTAITISNNDVTYDGTAKFVTVTTNPSDDAHTTVTYKIAGSNTSVTAPTLAGSYDVFVDVSGGSYVASSQGTLIIRKKTITAIVPDIDKEYDGTVFVSPIPTLSFASGDIVATDVLNVTVSGDDATFADKNIGSPKILTVSGIKIAGIASGNYQVLPISTNTNSSIFARTIDPSIYIEVTDTTKIYDGNININVPTLTIHGLLGGDNFTALRSTATANFDTKDVGTAKTVTVAGFTFSNPTLAANYSWQASYQNTNSSITPRPIDASIYIEVADTTKIYDGLTSVDVPSLTIHGLLGGDNFTALRSTATANFNTKDVGIAKTVTVAGFTFSNPTLAANYSWQASYQNTNSSITPRQIDANIYIEVADTAKIYDGLTSVDVPSLTILGLLGGDNFTALRSTATANFDTKDVGTAKTVTVAGFTFSNPTLAANYSWQASYQNTNSSITPRPIDASIYIEVADTTKIYDGLTSVDVPMLTIHGLLGGDNFTALRSTATANFDTKDMGTAKTVTVAGFTFSNPTLAANYSWQASYQNTNSSISQRQIDANIYIEVADTTKIYDGLTSIDVPSLTIHGLLGGDNFTALRSTATANFDTKDVGTAKTVTVAGFTFSNPTLAANYSWQASYQNTNSSITPRPIDASIYIEVADTAKIYDGLTSVDVPSLTIHGLLGGDNFTALRSTATANFDTKDVGTAKTVTVAGFTFSNPTLAANYSWQASYQNTNSSITPRQIDANIYIEVADTTKVYDGLTSVDVPSLTIQGLLGGDNFTALRSTATANFDTKDVGTAKTVTVAGFTFSNPTLAANYSWQASYQNTNSSITPRQIDANIYIEVADTAKIYDGLTSVDVPSLTIHGLLGSDNFTALRSTATANFDTKDVGTAKTVTVAGFTFSNPILAQNYTWNPSYQSKNSSITTMNITITPDEQQRRKYDEVETPFTYTTMPTTLPNNEALNGMLSREPSNDVGFYKILQGTVNNSNNPNYNITFVPDVDFEIYSGITMELKWGYSLVVNNTGDRFIAYQWYKNNELISGQTLQHYSLEKNLCGIYKVLVTFADGTKVLSQDTLFTNCNSTKQLVVAPTQVRAGGNIHIKIVDENTRNTSEFGDFIITIYSIDGTTILTSKCNELDNFSQLVPSVPGAYILKVLQGDKNLTTQKIIVY